MIRAGRNLPDKEFRSFCYLNNLPDWLNSHGRRLNVSIEVCMSPYRSDYIFITTCDVGHIVSEDYQNLFLSFPRQRESSVFDNTLTQRLRIPGKTRMTNKFWLFPADCLHSLHCHFKWIPAFAGMTIWSSTRFSDFPAYSPILLGLAFVLTLGPFLMLTLYRYRERTISYSIENWVPTCSLWGLTALKLFQNFSFAVSSLTPIIHVPTNCKDAFDSFRV